MDLFNPHRTHRAPRALAALAFAFATSAHALTVEPIAYPATFSPERVSPMREDGFWATGRVSGTGVLVRYDATGRVAFARRYDGTSDAPIALPDGGVILPYGCAATRLDAAGNPVWESSALGREYSCFSTTALDADLNLWTHGTCNSGACSNTARVVRFDRHGIVDLELDPTVFGLGRVGAVVASTNDVGAYVASADEARIVRLRDDGSRVWTYADGSLPAGTAFDRIALDPAGNVWAFVVTSAADGSAPRLTVVSLSPQGQLRFRRELPTIERPRFVDVSLDATGAAVLVGDVTILVSDFNNAMFPQFHGLATHRFSASGETLWRRDGQTDTSCSGCAVRLAGDGDVIASANLGGELGGAGNVRRFTTDGSLRRELDVPRRLLGVTATPDGGFLAIASRDGGSSYGFLRYTAAGDERAAPSTDVPRGYPQHIASGFGADGTTVVVTSDLQELRATVALVDAAGATRWRRDLAAHLSQSFPAVARGTQRTCWTAYRSTSLSENASDLVLECLHDASGALLWSVDLAVDRFPNDVGLVVLADNSVVVAFATRDAQFGQDYVRQMRFASDGTRLHATEWRNFPNVEASNAAGDVLLGNGSRVAVVDRDGTPRFDAALPSQGTQWAFDLTPSGRVTYVVRDFSQPTVYLQAIRLDATGALAWRAPLPEQGSAGMVHLASLGEDTIAATTESQSGQPARGSILRIAGDDGHRVWLRPRDDANVSTTNVAVDAATQSVAVVAGGAPGRAHVTVLDARTGALRRAAVEPCANAGCRIEGLGLDANATVRYIESGFVTGAHGGGGAFRLHSTDSRAPMFARVDQVGLAGTWYPEYATGQGLFLDYMPASQTLFGAWFNYTPDGGNDPADLRWYSLQGQVSANATEVTLDVLQNSRGTFAAGPATTATRVGSATLRLDRCDRATLEYEFNEGVNGGARGRYTLTRLTAPRGCAAPSGDIASQPTVGGGFDAAQSGSWTAVGTSGQGLLISIEPERLLFAGWFTYDPAGASDDAASQHWFSLQGSLAGASGGTITLPIQRTIGGSFDRNPTRNTFQVGTATLSFQSCDRATLEYQFGDDARAFAGRAGVVELEKIGGCTTP